MKTYLIDTFLKFSQDPVPILKSTFLSTILKLKSYALMDSEIFDKIQDSLIQMRDD